MNGWIVHTSAPGTRISLLTYCGNRTLAVCGQASSMAQEGVEGRG
jgi:hypothetical protein